MPSGGRVVQLEDANQLELYGDRRHGQLFLPSAGVTSGATAGTSTNSEAIRVTLVLNVHIQHGSLPSTVRRESSSLTTRRRSLLCAYAVDCKPYCRPLEPAVSSLGGGASSEASRFREGMTSSKVKKECANDEGLASDGLK